MPEVIDINTFSPSAYDRFFFDNNIWMYLFCPLGNYKKSRIKKYDRFLKKVVEAKAQIFISSLILSEFFNTFAHTEFNILRRQEPDKYKNFKNDFRNTNKYKKLLKDIKTIVKSQILKLANRLDDQFKSIDIDSTLDNIEEHDFNDKYSMELSMMNDLKIVTHDRDFLNSDLDFTVVTANKSLMEKKN